MMVKLKPTLRPVRTGPLKSQISGHVDITRVSMRSNYSKKHKLWMKINDGDRWKDMTGTEILDDSRNQR